MHKMPKWNNKKGHIAQNGKTDDTKICKRQTENFITCLDAHKLYKKPKFTKYQVPDTFF